jgi:hypothetical protein
VITEAECRAALERHGCKLYDKHEAKRIGTPYWRVAVAGAMREIGFEIRGKNQAGNTRFRRKLARDESGSKPAPKPIEAPTPRLLKTGPEVYVTRRSPRASMVEGGAR